MSLDVLASVLIGVLSGFLNALASGGSAVALPLLIATGLSPAMANATNRLPVVFAYTSASLTFYKEGRYERSLVLKILPPTVLGGLLGAWLADFVSRSELTIMINVALLISLVLLFTTVKEALKKTFEGPVRFRWQERLALFLVGIWLGLVVIDGATYLLLVFILGMHLTMDKANAYKALLGVLINIIALILFARDGNVDWAAGGLMSIGSVVGGYLGAKASMKPWAKVWTYRLLVIVMLGELIHMGVYYWHVR